MLKKKIRARRWLDENLGFHWDRSEVDGHYFAQVSTQDAPITAQTIEELAAACAEALGDPFRP